MSKAFDTIQRKALILDVEKILEPDEVQLYCKLLDVKLAVKCGSTVGEFFDTDTGGALKGTVLVQKFYLLFGKITYRRPNCPSTTNHTINRFRNLT